MALINIYNLLYEEGTDLRSRITGSIFLKANAELTAGTANANRLLFAAAAFANPRNYVQDFMIDFAANPTIAAKVAAHEEVFDAEVEYVVGQAWNRVADLKFPPA